MKPRTSALWLTAALATAALAACGRSDAPGGEGDHLVGPDLGCLGKGLNLSAPAGLAAGTGSWYDVAVDFNGDGKPDLAVINAGSLTDGTDGLSVLLNVTLAGTATPQFGAPIQFTTGLSPQALGVADLNGDGKPDLIVGNYLGPAPLNPLNFLSPSAGALSVFINQTPPGANTVQFAPRADFAAGPGTAVIAAADFNGDGLIDIAVTNFNTPGAKGVSVLLNHTPKNAAQPVLADPVSFDVGAAPIGLQAKDINGDGKPDLVVGNSLGFTVSVLINTTPEGADTSSFAPAVNFPVGQTGNGPETLDVQDINGDGRPDIVSPHFFTPGPGLISVLVNTTPPGARVPTFAPQVTFTAGVGPEQVVLADIDGDGRRDIVVANIGDASIGDEALLSTGAVPGGLLSGVSVLLNKTVPGSNRIAFADAQNFAAGSGPVGVLAGDFNADGRPDLVVVNMISGLGGQPGVSVLTNNGCTSP